MAAYTSLNLACGDDVHLDGKHKWKGVVVVGRKFFCAPFNSDVVWVFDADAHTASAIACGVVPHMARKWNGISAVGSKLYCAPHNAQAQRPG